MQQRQLSQFIFDWGWTWIKAKGRGFACAREIGSLVHVKLDRLYTWHFQLQRGSGWLVQGLVRCSVTLRGRRSTSVTCGGRWLTLRGRRSTSVTFGGRWLKHPGSVGAWLWVGWCREWYVAVWPCVTGAAPVWHVVAGDWRCVAGAAPVWHLVAGDWSILVALERGSGWLVQGMVRCSVTLRGRRSSSVRFGGRWLKRPGSPSPKPKVPKSQT